MDKLFFPKRALSNFIEAVKNRRMSPRFVKDLLKYKGSGIDVSEIEEFLRSSDDFIRMYSSQVVAVLGNPKKIIEAVKIEKEKNVLLDMLHQLTLTKDGLEELVYLLDNHDDKVIREAAILMFKKAGRADLLMSLLFSDDDDVVRRTKKWMQKLDIKNA